MSWSDTALLELSKSLKNQGTKLGFSFVGITDIKLDEAEQHLKHWLANGYQADMDYMSAHGSKRTHPEELIPGTLRVISVRMDYLNEDHQSDAILAQPTKAFISRYALGRDYHKTLRKRLNTLAKWIEEQIGPFGYRAFVDSAPVMERALAEKSGSGWIGKNTMVINAKAGSYFFLGEIYVDLPLPVDPPQTTMHCGSCQQCLTDCPTGAIVAPFQVDARRCISYLTIENKGPIPEEFRRPMGNRIYGCDDCQLVCPWNKFNRATEEADFRPRHQLDDVELLTLWNWDEATFLKKTEGSPIRRAGYFNWLRNIAVALGNAPYDAAIIEALTSKQYPKNEMVAEHIQWALAEQTAKSRRIAQN